MSKITFYLTILACFVTMIGIITALIRDIKKLKEEKKLLENNLLSARTNVAELANFIKNTDKIHKDEKVFAEKIEDAKSDEEVHKIIGDIIFLNNTRVQNH